MDHVVRGHALETALARAADRGTAALVAAALAAPLVTLSAHAARGGVARAGLVLLSTLAALCVLSGWPWDDSFHIPDPANERGRLGLAALAGAALVLVLVLSLTTRLPLLARTSRRTGLVLLGAGLPLLLGTPTSLRRLSGPGEQMIVREVAVDLTRESERWEVIAGPGRPAPYAGVLTPALDYKVDGGDRPSLILPHSTTLAFTVTEQDGPVRLIAQAGADRAAGRGRAESDGPLVTRLLVRVDGIERFVSTLELGADDAETARHWRPVGGGAGLELSPGQRVELINEIPHPIHARGWREQDRVGFGTCVLERRREIPRTRATPEAPNILFVVMDTLRADRTSLHGYARPTTPVLDSLAARGVTYENAYSTSSWTWPSTASLLTGLSPQSHGVESAKSCFLSHELVTLAEALQARGFTTCGFSANPLIVPDKFFDQGFEEFHATSRRFLASSAMVPDVLSWLRRNYQQRFFLYVHLVDPHEPHRPLPEHRSRFTSGTPADLPEGALTRYGEALLRAQGTPEAETIVPPEHLRWLDEVYDACVASGDTWFGELLAELDSLGIDDRTVVAFTSDHGEELMEHGLLKHGHALFPELVHVPLVLAGPGLPQGVRSDVPLSNRHLAPALARIGGARLEPPAGERPGLDLLSGAPEEAPVLFSTATGWLGGERYRRLVGLRSAGRVVHAELTEDGVRPLGLYDPQRDPAHLQPLQEPARALELAETAARRAADLARGAPAARAGGAGTVGMLLGLGYLGEDEVTPDEAEQTSPPSSDEERDR